MEITHELLGDISTEDSEVGIFEASNVEGFMLLVPK